MMKTNKLLLLGTLALTAVGVQAQKDARPNVVYILADDLGYGDISCFGQKNFDTPNIDKLAKQGMMFTQHYAGCTVSAPSRCVLMTGKHTGHSLVRGNKEMKPLEGQFPMKGSAFTLAEMFQQAGYTTGAFGKWGLGYVGSEGDANNQGFNEFFGYNCQRLAHRYYPEYLWHNREKVYLKGNDTKHKAVYAPDVIQEKTLDFIKANKNKPFFAYVALVQPHAELIVPDDDIFAKYKSKYPETPYVGQKKGSDYGDPDFDYMQYCSQPLPHATFAAMINRIDKYVGEIMAELKKEGLDKNTIVIFTSDNGPHTEGGADPDFFDSNSDYRGYKRDLTDGGIRVPMIAYWQNKIKAGTTSNFVSAFWDIMPTMAEIIKTKTPKDIDGLSILPTLLGKDKKQKQHDFLYWEFKERGGSAAVRIGDWKAIRNGLNKNPNAPVELYNIVKDSEEMHNVADQHPDIVAKALKVMKEQHVLNTDYPFDFEKPQKGK